MHQENQQIDINAIIAQFHNNRNQIFASEKSVIFIGNSGTGKTTLLNYILGNPLIAEDGFGFKIRAENEIPGLVIAPDESSQTTVPYGHSIGNGVVYWDCPGFGDNRGTPQELLNSMYVSALCSVSQNTKIVIAIKEDDIMHNRSEDLKKMISSIVALFPDVHDLASRVMMIVTQTQEFKTEDDVSLYLNNIFNNMPHGNERELLELISNNNIICLFPMPIEEGAVSPVHAVRINSIINSIEYGQNLHATVGLTEHARHRVNLYIQSLNDEIARVFSKVNTNLINTSKQIVIDSNNKAEIETSLENIKDLITTLPHDKEIFLQSYNELLNYLHIGNNPNYNIGELFAQLQSLQLIVPNIMTDNGYHYDNWYSRLSIDGLNKLTNPVEEENNSQYVWTIKGFTVDAGDIVNKIVSIGNQQLEVKQINVFAIDTCYLNNDIQKPGLRLSIFANRCKVSNTNISINLRGENARDIHGLQQNQFNSDNHGNGVNGRDGIPGNPGAPGGSLFIKANYIINVQNLTINVSGGDGGKGQNGGNASDGDVNNFAKHKELIDNRNDNYMVYKRKLDYDDLGWFAGLSKDFFTYNEIYKEVFEVNCNPLSGGNGGKGGSGGKAGLPGRVDILPYRASAQIINNDTDIGESGIPGEPGIGADGGRYRGVYINHKIFGNLRETESPKVTTTIGTSSAATTGIVLKQGATLLIQKGGTKVVQDGVKHIVPKGATVVVEKMFNNTVIEGVKTITKQGTKTIVETIKQSGEVVKTTILNGTKVGFDVAKAGVSLLTTAAIQTVGSVILAQCLSDWEEAPRETARQNAINGTRFDSQYNNQGLVEPNISKIFSDNEKQELSSTYEIYKQDMVGELGAEFINWDY